MGNAREPESQEWDLVVEFTRDVVAIAAPGELPLVELTAATYRADPGGSERRVRQGKEILGFGADELIAITPFALPVAAAVLQSLLTQFSESFADVDAAGTRARARLRRLLRRSAAPGATDHPPEALTADQLAQVRLVAYTKATELGLSETRSDLLADAVVGHLALPAPG